MFRLPAICGVALIALADVDHLGALLEQPVELVEADGVDVLDSAAEDVALELEVADRAEGRAARCASSTVAAWTTTRSVTSRTKPDFVAKELPTPAR